MMEAEVGVTWRQEPGAQETSGSWKDTAPGDPRACRRSGPVTCRPGPSETGRALASRTLKEKLALSGDGKLVAACPSGDMPVAEGRVKAEGWEVRGAEVCVHLPGGADSSRPLLCGPLFPGPHGMVFPNLMWIPLRLPQNMLFLREVIIHCRSKDRQNPGFAKYGARPSERRGGLGGAAGVVSQ